MATSDRLVRYLGSTKNLLGCLGGLVGVLLHLVGLVAGLWPLVVAALYAAGALVAPPERVRLITDTGAEASRLKADLDTLTREVRDRAARLPAGAVESVDRIAEVLSDVLTRPTALAADPESTHAVTRLIRADVPLAVETYLNLPWWLTVRKRTGGTAPDAELTTQLALLETDANTTATRFFDADLRKQSDHTRYLRDRIGADGDADRSSQEPDHSRNDPGYK